MTLRPQTSRRIFLGQSAVLAGVPLLGLANGLDAAPEEPLKIAAVFTEFRFRSHAFNILENFLEDLLFNGKWHKPDMKVVSFYADQFPENDTGRATAKEYKIRLCKSIEESLCLGSDQLAVDAVLLIGEHGDYPTNAKGVKEYPRKKFFDEIVAVFKKSKRVVPVFNDKHLSYRWDWAKEMVDTAREMKIPLMAGSSVPLAVRQPALELPREPRIVEAVSIHGGPFEIYDFHGLEVMQSLVESRRGGETGVKQVRFLKGDALWKAADEGLWTPAVADAAMAAEIGPGQPTLRELVKKEPYNVEEPWGVHVTYRDGLRGIVLKVGKSTPRWNFACRLASEEKPRACRFYVGPWGNRNLFMALSHAIQVHFRKKESPYPIERTLLTTGILEAAVDSHQEKGKVIATPHLEIAYKGVDFSAVRENGDSWKVITEKTPQAMGLKKH